LSGLRVRVAALASVVTLALGLGLGTQAFGGPRAREQRVATVGDKIQAKQAEIDAIHRRLENKRSLLHFQELRSSDLQAQLAQTNAGIARVSADLDTLGGRVQWNQRRLAWNQVQLDAAEATLERHNEALRRRLVDAYERGDLGYVNVLLSASSFTDFVERWDDIRYLIAANQKTVRERRAAERAVAGARSSLERERLALQAAIDRERQAKFQLAGLAQEREQLVGVAEAQRRSVANEVVELEDVSAAEEAALEEMIRERQREEAERRATEEAARRRAAQLAGQELPPATPSGGPGDFSWPVSGPITSPFGMRSNPMGQGFEMHPGIDIGAPMGATVTAAAGGRVIWAKEYGGYGNAIIIDHGAQTSSVYGHLSQIFVAEGQDVTRGQAIGAVGCSGRCTGPHLHFEVRVNGVAVDPTSRLH
jgi:murein DD-endopeptidase MepM/ murein hydrolase activator NlpD